MKVSLINYPVYLDLCQDAAAICTNAKNKAKAFAQAVASGHNSILEHASFTFRVEGVSRVLLAQLTRHRLASFSVESQRYCGANLDMIVPDSMARADLVDDMVEVKKAVKALYDKALSLGVEEEDARYFTLQGGLTNLIVTMNARELHHFFSLRCCNRAQWEIRDLADMMLALCQNRFPEYFDNAGPGCVRGSCPEARPCGHPRVKA